MWCSFAPTVPLDVCLKHGDVFIEIETKSDSMPNSIYLQNIDQVLFLSAIREHVSIINISTGVFKTNLNSFKLVF